MHTTDSHFFKAEESHNDNSSPIHAANLSLKLQVAKNNGCYQPGGLNKDAIQK